MLNPTASDLTARLTLSVAAPPPKSRPCEAPLPHHGHPIPFGFWDMVHRDADGIRGLKPNMNAGTDTMMVRRMPSTQEMRQTQHTKPNGWYGTWCAHGAHMVRKGAEMTHIMGMAHTLPKTTHKMQ